MKAILRCFFLTLITGLLACQSKPTDTQRAQVADSSTTTTSTQLSTVSSLSAAPSTVSNDFLIVPGERVGPIRRNTSEAELLKVLGSSVVTVGDSLSGAEGEEFVGTTLYKGTVDEVQIFYNDDARNRPSTVLIRPDFTDDEGNSIAYPAAPRWTTTQGIRIGTTLKEVEKLNGKPFKLWGFEWDYSGLVADWRGGTMTPRSKHKFLSMSFGPPLKMTSSQQKDYNKLLGDGDFLSSNAAMQRLNPTVGRLDTGF